MAEPAAQMALATVGVVNESQSAAAESQNKPATQSETILQHTLDTMQNSDSDLTPRAEKNIASEFWPAYERVAKQHDDELIDRHGGDLDALLIFAGLFSSVSSAFIVNMESSLSPQPSDTTNALLKVLINKIDNGTFSDHEASLPVWTGPGAPVIWIQALAYTSLSMSLLAALGGVLGKQWLGHFKTSRFGQGTLHERCTRRQQKLDGLKVWHFNTIIASLPILLQLSLLSFGIALAANLWTLQHTVAGVMMGTTSFGVIFYFFTVVASLKSPDCPFQTPVSTLLDRIMHVFRKKIMYWAHQLRPKSWTSLPCHLRTSFRTAFQSGKDMISRTLARFRVYLWRTWLAVRETTLSLTNDTESVGGSDKSTTLDWYQDILRDILGHPAEPAGAHSIEWIIQTSTDMDIITNAVMMVPEVEWPDKCDVTFVLDQLTNHLYACFNSTGHISPHTRERARTCLKAIFHLYAERGLQGPLSLHDYDIFYHTQHLHAVPREHDFQVISCMTDGPNEVDIASLPFSDRMWMAHILSYHLHNGPQPSSIYAFVHEFIEKCFHDPNSPPRLVADCLILAGLMIGLRPARKSLAKIDKSAAIGDVQGLVIDRILELLLGETPVSQRGYSLNARKLLRPLSYCQHGQYYANYERSVQCLKLCFHFLEDLTTDGTQVQITDIAAGLRISLFYSIMTEELNIWTYLYRARSKDSLPYWGGPPYWHTQAQFDLLVDYLVQVGKGTDYTAIGDACAVSAGLRGSPSTLKRKRLYIQTMLRLMGSEIPLRARHAALSAAHAVRADIASVGRDDEPLRELFSQALISVIQAADPVQQRESTSFTDSPLNKMLKVNRERDRCYLGLLRALSKEPTWHGNLDCHSHFKSCLVIADSLSSRLRTDGGNGDYAVYITHTFAIVDDLGEDHKFLRAVHTYSSWPLILRAWRRMFGYAFFYQATVENWMEFSSWETFESLPSVAAYAMRHWEQWDNREETHRLVQLVKQICDKLDEERSRSIEQSVMVALEPGQEDSFGHQGIPKLSDEIRRLLYILWGDI